MDSFLTPTGLFESEHIAKRSKFIAACAPVEGKGQGKLFIAARAKAHPAASHHCWAMVAGAPNDFFQQDQSDDGEPRGSAGKPMLNVLMHSNMGELIVVVSRYFGGTKLGVGGLVRAYSQATQDVLDIVQSRRIYSRSKIDITLPYTLLSTVEYRLPEMNCEICSKTFDTTVKLSVLVPTGQEESFVAFLNQLGSGSITVIPNSASAKTASASTASPNTENTND